MKFVYIGSSNKVLIHHGVKGQRKGIKNGPPYPIKRDGVFRNPKTVNIIASNGLKVTSFSKHVENNINQKQDRHVTTADIHNAVKKPLHIDPIKMDSNGNRSQRFIGLNATVNVNPDTGVVATVWKTGSDKIKKYKKGGK